MDDVVHQSTPWSLHGTIGQLTSGKFSAAVDAASPQAGLRHQSLDHEQSRCSFLCASRESTHSSSLAMNHGDARAWPLPVVEAYVRGDDFVAGYGPTDNWPYS